MSDNEKINSYFDFSDFYSKIPNLNHPQCLGIRNVIKYLLDIMYEPIGIPNIEKMSWDGTCKMTWLKGKSYMSISVNPGGDVIWFYKGNNFNDFATIKAGESYTDSFRECIYKLCNEYK